MNKRSIHLSRFVGLFLAASVVLAGCHGGTAGDKQHWYDLWKKEPKATQGVSDFDMLPPPPAGSLGPGESEALELPPIIGKSFEEIEKAGGIPQSPSPRVAPAGSVSELQPVYFAYDSAELDQRARAMLEADSTWLLSNPNVQVQVEGHCDERGTREYNFALGERRALSVRNYLASKNVPPSNLIVISYGEERPIASGNDEEAWAQNRRAQFQVYR